MSKWWLYAGIALLSLVVGCVGENASPNAERAANVGRVASALEDLVATTTSLTSSVNPSAFGQATTLTASVTSANGTPDGTVTFSDGAATLGTVALDVTGTATLAVSSLGAGTHALTAAYAPGGAFLPSTSDPVSHMVSKASTMTMLATAASPTAIGATATFTATVTAVAPGGGIPTGTVTFREGPTSLGTASLDPSGTATFSTKALSVGSHSLVADYGADANFVASTSAAIAHVVSQDASSVAVTITPNPSTLPAQVTVIAVVSSAGTGGVPTGTVTFKDGTTFLGTGSLDVTGTATYSTSALSPGAHTIFAEYGGDAKHTAASSSQSLSVLAGVSTTTSASMTNPSVFGQSVTFTAKVAGAGVTPTGNVSFFDGTNLLSTRPLDASGQASFSASALSVGAHAIGVVYAGDANFATSSAAAISQQVNAAATTTVVSASNNPSIVGVGVTFRATVSASAPGAGLPTGTVTFKDGTDTIGTGTLDASGQASLAITTLAPGSHSITAVYGADGNFAASTSAALAHTVNQDGVSASLASSLNPSTFGSSVTFSAKVSASGSGIPTGTVTFKDGDTILGTATIDATGATSFSTTALTGGTHTITAVYGGDATHGTGTASVSQIVKAATTTTALTSSANPSVFGQPTKLSASVTSTVTGTRTGNVTFMDGTTVLGTTALDVSGVATLTSSTLVVGTHPLSAVYAGDSNFAMSTSSALSQTVDRAKTTTVLASSSNPSLVDASVTFTATVAAKAPGAGTRTGTVAFKEGATTLGTASLDVSGVATFATSALASGNHAIAAEYVGDGHFEGSASNTLAQVVNTAAPTIAVTSTPSPSMFTQSVTFTIMVTGARGVPSGTVALEEEEASLGTGTLDPSGVATIKSSKLAVGTHTLTASYRGDAVYATGSGSLTHVVQKAVTTTTIASAANPSKLGATVTFTATVLSNIAGASGSIEFFDGTVSLGSAPLADGSAALSTSALAEGGHAIKATYAGTESFAGSSSAVVNQVVEADVVAPIGDPGTSPEGGASPTTPAASGDSGGGCQTTSRTGSASSAAVFVMGALGVLVLARRRRRT
ncbi:Flagellar hook-length control protein FliK [Labilithrix luteola]|uniref:Flagellar hook-length control protein FliK n=1 Tax=Labilithrix luteola TaxID=1391654 RepID=A0A0K1Q4H5_9BACT|nr:Ig-like domain-containing protein [Labilithrix luteola]AKV00567.1 Flagellar hook-length control protein FliK [Labilithrix luteola]